MKSLSQSTQRTQRLDLILFLRLKSHYSVYFVSFVRDFLLFKQPHILLRKVLYMNTLKFCGVIFALQ
jgi:hypothetical protein